MWCMKEVMATEREKSDIVEEECVDKSSPVKEEDVSEPTGLCTICGQDPCIRLELEEMLVSIVQTFRGVKSNKQIQFYIYTNAVRYIYGGSLGKGVRKKILDCLQRMIHALAPDKEYTGF